MSAWVLPKTGNLRNLGTLMRKARRLFPDYNDQNFLRRKNILNVESVHNLCAAKNFYGCVNEKPHLCVEPTN